MGKVYHYLIPRIPESLNKYAGRTNVFEYRKEKEIWREIMALLCCERPPQPLARSVVELSFYFPDRRRRDLDNYIKPVTDGLVAAKIIEDDCYQCIDLVLHGAYDKQNPRVEISVQGME